MSVVVPKILDFRHIVLKLCYGFRLQCKLCVCMQIRQSTFDISLSNVSLPIRLDARGQRRRSHGRHTGAFPVS
jgi:hypothetical protein